MNLLTLDGAAPTIDAPGGAWVAPNVWLIGDVGVARDVSIWFGTTIRADNDVISIEEGSNIQEMCLLHTDKGHQLRVGRDSTIGHGVILHGCQIGNNTLVGMGAIILNGAVIGDNCLIGAGALITEGKQIPDNSVVLGSPGRIARQVTPEEQAGNLRTAQKYVLRARTFAAAIAAEHGPT